MLLYTKEKKYILIIKLFLELGKVDADLKDHYSQTWLSYAAEKGDEVIVKLLLESGKVDADSKDKYNQMLL